MARYPDVSGTSGSSGVLTSPMAAQPAPVLPAAPLAAPLFKGPPPGLQCWGTATWTQLLPQLPPPLTLAPGAKVKAAPPDGSPLWVRPPLPLQQQNPGAAFTSETNYAKDVGPPLDVGLALQQQDPEAAFTSQTNCAEDVGPPLQQQNPEAAFMSQTNYAKDVGPPLQQQNPEAALMSQTNHARDVGLPLQQQNLEAAFMSQTNYARDVGPPLQQQNPNAFYTSRPIVLPPGPKTVTEWRQESVGEKTWTCRHCCVCDSVILDHNYEAHINSRRHRRKLHWCFYEPNYYVTYVASQFRGLPSNDFPDVCPPW